MRGAGLAGSTVIVSLPSVGSTNSRPDAIAATFVSSSQLCIYTFLCSFMCEEVIPRGDRMMIYRWSDADLWNWREKE